MRPLSTLRGPGQRLTIPDVLRGVAILAMLIAHAGPFVPQMPWALDVLRSNINDLASPLFALVMGMSAQLTWNRSTSHVRTLAQQTVRGVLLVLLGVWLVTWGSWVAIVLQPLGLLLIVGTPLLLLGTRGLAATAVLVALLSQPVVDAARASAAQLFSHGAVVALLADWTVIGHNYRLMNLLPFFLLGGLLARAGFKRDRAMWGMLAFAPLAYLTHLVAVRMLNVDVQSGDYLDTLHDVGLVFAAYALVVLISAAALSGRGARLRDAVFTPFRAWGQLALSLYLLHVAVIALWNNAEGRPDHNVHLGWLVIVPGMALIGWLWWRFIGTGPVEWAMGLVIGRRKSWRRPRAGRAAESVEV